MSPTRSDSVSDSDQFVFYKTGDVDYRLIIATKVAQYIARLVTEEMVKEYLESGEIINIGNVLGGNYTSVETGGQLVNHGTGRTWNDLPPIPLLSQRSAAVNNPSLATFVGNIQQLTFAVNDYVYGNYELLHEYAEGTDLEPHVHFATNSVDGTDRAVKWELEYSISNADVTPPFTQAFPVSTVISSEVVIPANTPTRSHVLATELPSISGTGLLIGAYIVWRLRRIASVGTAPSANPFGLTLGFHILQNTQGSDEIGHKNIG